MKTIDSKIFCAKVDADIPLSTTKGGIVIKPGFNVNALAVTLFKVQIEGRGGDSVHDEYFETRGAAILASAIDGGNHEPEEVIALKFPDGSIMKLGEFIHITHPPHGRDVAKLRESFTDRRTPAERLLSGT